MNERKAKKRDAGVEDLELKELVLKDDGSVVVSAEQNYITITTHQSKNGSYTVHNYYNLGMMFANITPTGELDWITIIPKKQLTRNDGAMYNSFSLLVNRDKLRIIYNENPLNFKVTDPRKMKYMVSPKKAMTTLVTINHDGTFSKTPLFPAKEAKTIVIPKFYLNTSADEIIPVLIEALDVASLDTHWMESLRSLYSASFKDEYPDWSLSPFLLIQALNELFFNSPVQYVADVGNNQMWAAHTLRLSESQSAHYSGGLGAMGFALPAAIGVQLSSSAPTVVITGDGGVQLNIQELDVIARDNLPILVVVLNNRTLGMVRNFQEMYFEGRNQTTYWGGHTCSFVGIAAGYNVEGYLVTDLNVIREKIASFISNPRPLLLEIEMLGANECRPRLAYGSALDKQFP
ncbi:MAG: hypothetical protein EOP48_19110, partial [Sphingobacteriales bacterium]